MNRAKEAVKDEKQNRRQRGKKIMNKAEKTKELVASRLVYSIGLDLKIVFFRSSACGIIK